MNETGTVLEQLVCLFLFIVCVYAPFNFLCLGVNVEVLLIMSGVYLGVSAALWTLLSRFVFRLYDGSVEAVRISYSCELLLALSATGSKRQSHEHSPLVTK